MGQGIERKLKLEEPKVSKNEKENCQGSGKELLETVTEEKEDFRKVGEERVGRLLQRRVSFRRTGGEDKA